MRHTILIKPLPLIEVCLQNDDSLLLKTAKKVFGFHFFGHTVRSMGEGERRPVIINLLLLG